ncbi:oxepin-CoA hydrolase, alternative type [Sagittula sp. SSi028]|uniref:oxepin-CoA hydrolase, alternative type n=1 Tax=Sagittula sp. SSi028 TaxID=3400636 RepID=UPI003AF97869
MTESSIDSQWNGPVLTLTINGPQSRNSISGPQFDALRATVIDAPLQGARAIVITGAAGYFCSGGNIHKLKESAARPRAQSAAGTDALNAMIRAVHDAPVPVICAMEGGAAGAGASLALACDMIVAAEGASLVIAYVKVGLSPDGGATHFLRSALPRQLAMEMCLLGRPMPVERLHQFGVVNEVVAKGAALAQATDLAARLARGPAQAIATIKHEVNTAPRNDLLTHLALEADGINRARYGAEAAEGLAAFLEKRKPDFPSA